MLENSRKFFISFISPKFPRTENKIAGTVGHFVEKIHKFSLNLKKIASYLLILAHCKPKVSDLQKLKAKIVLNRKA